MAKVKALFSGFVGFKGMSLWLHEGQEVDQADPMVEAHPEWFTEPAERPRAQGRRGSQAADS